MVFLAAPVKDGVVELLLGELKLKLELFSLELLLELAALAVLFVLPPVFADDPLAADLLSVLLLLACSLSLSVSGTFSRCPFLGITAHNLFEHHRC